MENNTKKIIGGAAAAVVIVAGGAGIAVHAHTKDAIALNNEQPAQHVQNIGQAPSSKQASKVLKDNKVDIKDTTNTKSSDKENTIGNVTVAQAKANLRNMVIENHMKEQGKIAYKQAFNHIKAVNNYNANESRLQQENTAQPSNTNYVVTNQSESAPYQTSIDYSTPVAGYVNIANGYLNFRNGASLSSNIIGHLTRHQPVNIVGTKGNWYKAEVGGQTGWVWSGYINKGTVNSTPVVHHEIVYHPGVVTNNQPTIVSQPVSHDKVSKPSVQHQQPQHQSTTEHHESVNPVQSQHHEDVKPEQPTKPVVPEHHEDVKPSVKPEQSQHHEDVKPVVKPQEQQPQHHEDVKPQEQQPQHHQDVKPAPVVKPSVKPEHHQDVKPEQPAQQGGQAHKGEVKPDQSQHVPVHHQDVKPSVKPEQPQHHEDVKPSVKPEQSQSGQSNKPVVKPSVKPEQTQPAPEHHETVKPQPAPVAKPEHQVKPQQTNPVVKPEHQVKPQQSKPVVKPQEQQPQQTKPVVKPQPAPTVKPQEQQPQHHETVKPVTQYGTINVIMKNTQGIQLGQEETARGVVGSADTLSMPSIPAGYQEVSITVNGQTVNSLPSKFEAGTQNVVIIVKATTAPVKVEVVCNGTPITTINHTMSVGSQLTNDLIPEGLTAHYNIKSIDVDGQATGTSINGTVQEGQNTIVINVAKKFVQQGMAINSQEFNQIFANEVCSEVNAIRAQHGLSQLKETSLDNQAASYKAQDMDKTGLTHICSNGKTLNEIYGQDAAGAGMGANLGSLGANGSTGTAAYAKQLAQEAVNLWMSSAAHQSAILNASVLYEGASVHYYVNAEGTPCVWVVWTTSGVNVNQINWN